MVPTPIPNPLPRPPSPSPTHFVPPTNFEENQESDDDEILHAAPLEQAPLAPP